MDRRRSREARRRHSARASREAQRKSHDVGTAASLLYVDRATGGRDRLHVGTAASMAAAQSLFEAGLITYHRTDSPSISDEAFAKIADARPSTACRSGRRRVALLVQYRGDRAERLPCGPHGAYFGDQIRGLCGR